MSAREPSAASVSEVGVAVQREHEIRRMVVRWMTEPEPVRTGHETCVRTMPASPDDVLWLLDEVKRLRQERQLLYGEIDKALGPLAPGAWDRITEAMAR